MNTGATGAGWRAPARKVLPLLAMGLLAVLLGCAPEEPPPAGGARAVPPGFELETAIDGLVLPTGVEFAPDGRVFVIEKRGTVLAFDGLDDPSSTVVADLSDNIHNYEDRGLLGLAVDPDFPAEPYVYVLYTLDRGNSWNDTCPTPPGTFEDGCVVDGRLSRLAVDEASQLVGEEHVLLEDRWCAQFPSHTIGDLAFMDDGSLLVSAGDGADFNNVDYGQNGGSPDSPTPANPCGDPPVPVGEPHTLPAARGGALRSQALINPEPLHTYDGAILRVDPDTGQAHPTNPLVGEGDPLAQRVIAHGLRNPYRMAARPDTSEVWLGDVGWGAWEEVNRIVDVEDSVVENFGWPCYEGAERLGSYDGLDLDLCERLYDGTTPTDRTEPYFGYRHGAAPDPEVCGSDLGSAVTAISFYETGSYPDEYDGALFFGDYARGCVWSMALDAGGQPDPTQIETMVAGVAPVDLEQGPGGDMFLVDIVAGSIRRIGFDGRGMQPSADIQASTDSGPVPLSVDFDGRGSDPNVPGDLTYEWDLDGDGDYDDGGDPTASHTYTEAGTVTVRLRVTNAEGLSDTASVTVHAGNSRPQPVIESPEAGTRWAVGDELAMAGSATDAEDGPLGPAAFEWQVNLHHCSSSTDCHAHFLETINGQDSATVLAPDHEFPSHLELVLTVTDSSGLTGRTSLRLDPRTVEVVLRSNPPGLALNVGSRTVTTPSTLPMIVGSRPTLGAPPDQQVGEDTFVFHSWSDQGTRVHEVTVTEPTTYTASYVPAGPAPDPDVVYLSDLPWVEESNGFGPAERDMTNGDPAPEDGGPLSLRGQLYAKGIGAHADSHIVVDVPQPCSRLAAVVGIDDWTGPNGTVTFSVLGDGEGLATTPVLQGAVSDPYPLVVDLTGIQRVTLVADDTGDNNFSDHADWADVRFTGCSGDPGPPGGFDPPVSLPAGDRPHSVVAHDLDGDADLDLAAAVPGEDAAMVFLNTGSGFAGGVAYPTGAGTFPKHVEVGDVDGDGHPDLVSANQDSTSGQDVTVFPGVGDGTFGPPVSYEACSRPHQTALGDVDGDGSLDVVVACWDGDVVSVLLNDGAVALGPATDFPAAYGPHSLVLRDLDGDDDLDLAVAAWSDNRIAVLPGNGDGTFAAPALYWSGLGPHNVTAGDLDEDGDVDLVSTAQQDDAVGVLLGRGDGTFADTVFYPVGSTPKAAALGDLNGDGDVDLVTANTHGNYPDGTTPTTLTVLLGRGDGSFAEGFTLDHDLTPFSVAVADLYGDGTNAIVTANWHSDDLKVWRRRPDG